MERPEVVGTEEGQGGESSVTWENNFGRETWTLNPESSLSLTLSIHLPLYLQIPFTFQHDCILIFGNGSVQSKLYFWFLHFVPVCTLVGQCDNTSAQLLVK